MKRSQRSKQGGSKHLRPSSYFLRQAKKILLGGQITGLCSSCGFQFNALHLIIDHRKRLADGGTNDISNLQLLCERCHKRKSLIECSPRAKVNPETGYSQ